MLNDVERIKSALADSKLKVEWGDIEVGVTYPLYATITKFIDDRPGRVVVELNYGQMIAELALTDVAHIENLKSRAFDPGIFIATVEQNSPQIRVSCTTVIFGTKSDFNA